LALVQWSLATPKADGDALMAVTVATPPLCAVTVTTAVPVVPTDVVKVTELGEALMKGWTPSRATLPPPVDAATSVNQMLPSGPTVIPWAGYGLAVEEAAAEGTGYSLRSLPVVSMTPTALLPWSVNQMLPSGPMVMDWGAAAAVVVTGRAVFVIASIVGVTPGVGGMRPILPGTAGVAVGSPCCVNQTLPSPEVVMPPRLVPAVLVTTVSVRLFPSGSILPM
jgi:hypothetical protein